MQQMYPAQLRRLTSFTEGEAIPEKIQEMFESIREANPDKFKSFLIDPQDMIEPSSFSQQQLIEEDDPQSKEDRLSQQIAERINHPQYGFRNLTDVEIPKPTTYFLLSDPIVHRQVETICPSEAAKKWFQSGSIVGSTRWMWLGCTKIPLLAISEEEYLDCLRLRLLIPIFVRDPHFTRACPCGQKQGEDDYAYHSLSCTQMSANTFRHDLIKEALRAYLEGIGKREVATEVPVAGNSHLRLDITYQDGASVKYIDVSVANPTASTFHPNPVSEMEPGTPALMKEREKIRKYVNQNTGISIDNFVPFVIEASGRFGPEAAKFIDAVSGIAKKPSLKEKKLRNFLLQRLSTAMARGNSRHLQNYRERSVKNLRIVQPEVRDDVPSNGPVIVRVSAPSVRQREHRQELLIPPNGNGNEIERPSPSSNQSNANPLALHEREGEGRSIDQADE